MNWPDHFAKRTNKLVGQVFLGPWTARIGSGLNALYHYRESTEKVPRRSRLWYTSARVIISFEFGTVTLHYLEQAMTSMCDHSVIVVLFNSHIL